MVIANLSVLSQGAQKVLPNFGCFFCSFGQLICWRLVNIALKVGYNRGGSCLLFFICLIFCGVRLPNHSVFCYLFIILSFIALVPHPMNVSVNSLEQLIKCISRVFKLKFLSLVFENEWAGLFLSCSVYFHMLNCTCAYMPAYSQTCIHNTQIHPKQTSWFVLYVGIRHTTYTRPGESMASHYLLSRIERADGGDTLNVWNWQW